MAKLDDERKEVACCYLASLNFRWFVSVSHKSNMQGHRNKRAEVVKFKNYFYNWMARVLLEKVTQYCQQDALTRYRGKLQHGLCIESSSRGGMLYPHTQDYLAKLWIQSQQNKLHASRDDLAWDVFDFQQVYHFLPKEPAGLQLADVVTSACLLSRPWTICQPSCAHSICYEIEAKSGQMPRSRVWLRS